MTQAMTPERLDRLQRTVGSVETDRMGGDNLAIVLCSFFDNPDQPDEPETGWTEDGVAGCTEVLDAIKAHYAPAFAEIDRLTAELTRRDEVEAALRNTLKLHAGDTLSLNNEIVALRDDLKAAEECLADMRHERDTLRDTETRLRSQADGLAAALRKAKYALKGREHDGFIDEALATYDSGKDGK